MSQAGANNTNGGGGGSGITTINGDSGSVTGAVVSFNAENIAGASVSFSGSGTLMSLNTSDSQLNTLIGQGTGGSTGTLNTALGTGSMITATGNENVAIGPSSLETTSGTLNVAVGAFSLRSLTTGSSNVSIGDSSGINLTSGSNNTIISGGGNYTGAESNNIVIENAGVIGDSNTIRIGTQGAGTSQQNACFVAGIAGVTVANQENVTVNAATGQMGSFSASAFYAYLGTTASNVTGDTTFVGPIIFNTVAAGSSPNYSGSSGFFTAPDNGWYTFQCSITLIGGTLIDRWRVDFYGSAFIEQGVSLQPSSPIASATQILSASITIPMIAGDEIGIGALASGDATKTVSIGGGAPGSGNSTSSFSGYRIS